jgi:hypothetical protein
MKEKCIRQYVLTAERNAKFPSNLTEADRYTAENAIQKEDLLDQDSSLS